MKAFVVTVLHFAGSHPGKGFTWVGKGMDLLFAHCGSWQTVDVTENSALVVGSGLPPELIGDRVWLDSVASALAAIYELFGRTGEVEVVGVEAATATVRYRAVWS